MGNQKPEKELLTADVHVKVPPAHRAAIRAAAELAGMTVSQYCRLRLLIGGEKT